MYRFYDRIFTIIICMLICGTTLVPLFSCVADSQSIKVISASPGQTVLYQGQGSPNSQVSIEIGGSIQVGTTPSGDNYTYNLKMNGISSPGGGLWMSVKPVDTLSIKATWAGWLGSTRKCSVVEHIGYASNNNIPAGSYNVEVFGVANSPGPVTITVRVSQVKSTDSIGSYTLSVSTSGLPSSVYSIKQDGSVVAMVYLGVPAPATPTPEPTISPTPGPSATPSPNATITPTPVITISPSPGVSVVPVPGTANGPGIYTPSPPGGVSVTTLPPLNDATISPTSTPAGGPSSQAPESSPDTLSAIIAIAIVLIVFSSLAYLLVIKKYR